MLDRDIKSLITILEESSIEEMEITTFWGKQKIRLRKNVNKNITPLKNYDYPEKNIIDQTVDELTPNKPINEVEVVNNIENKNITIKAPLVGTFYLSAKPNEPPYIKEGDNIQEGQTICIIEAMKIFNEIESDFDGSVHEILIDDNSPVEFNQSIISIIPE